MRAIKSEWNYKQHCLKIVRESQKRRRAFAKECGLCSICCRNKADTGYMTCLKCRKRVVESQERRRKENE